MILYGYRNPQTFQRCKGTTFFETSKSFLKKYFATSLAPLQGLGGLSPCIVCLDNSCRLQIKNFHLWSESFCEISRINVLFFFFGKIVCRQDKIRNTCIDRKGRDKGTHKRKGYGQRINPYNFRGFKFFINSFFCAKNSHKL